MFTGIIEAFGEVKEVIISGSNRVFWLHSSLAPQLKVDQSLSHDGVCLTVEEITEQHYRVTAVQETLEKTTLKDWKLGTIVNLERSLITGGRLDGHFVQGHVDTIGKCESITDKGGSWEMEFQFPKEFSQLIIEKGSICVNGASLTAFNVKKKHFTVAVIPFTYEHTNLKHLVEGSHVNLEFDMIGKYIQRRS